ncbi:Helicase associated domain (HA2) [Carpediemonas membranifera]|uniref:Helicase associated domain (HA2) n=1 Tax=Carpediemonas membranifera TaxID=201153 RepID=A0A8J6DZR5_9EUKA|nr:Helicase associated domain (HA2) [Carpediemonas membranifera]|eukprot:KAG9391103.1 Helicase associated domain (HA2) [Carpediemonas membranifera]
MEDWEQAVVDRTEAVLPILQDNWKEKIVDTVKALQGNDLMTNPRVLVITGETGSGKTTQIPQFLLSCGLTSSTGSRTIVCTQPRRVAAMSVAEQVARERNVELGSEVGYKVRFDNKTTRDTLIKYCTDGILLRELMTDPMLDRYACVILDEVHERTLATDILMGVLKDLLRRRSDLTVVLMSATLNVDNFTSFFNAAALHIPGRVFPVEVKHDPEDAAALAEQGYLDVAVERVKKIMEDPETPLGDILVFLPGADDINSAVDTLGAWISEKAEDPEYERSSIAQSTTLPLYGALPLHEQHKVFLPPAPGGRKIIFATNVAETSITIPGIVFVVDPGLAKAMVFDAGRGTKTLSVIPVSKASSTQRKGRAGRTAAGVVYRLYSEASYNAQREETPPQFTTSNLTNVLLQMISLELNPETFAFLSAPPKETLAHGMKSLKELCAIEPETTPRGRVWRLTKIGKTMSALPIAPELSAVLIEAGRLGVTTHMLSLVAMLEIPNIFARRRHGGGPFVDKLSDHFTFINLYNEYAGVMARNPDNPVPLKAFCQLAGINDRAMASVVRLRVHLAEICADCGLDDVSSIPVGDAKVPVMKALLHGFYRNVCVWPKSSGGGFRVVAMMPTAEEKSMLTGWKIHPSSVVHSRELMRTGNGQPWFLFHEQLVSSHRYLICVSKINPKILIEAMPQIFDPDNPMVAAVSDKAMMQVMRIVKKTLITDKGQKRPRVD